MAKDTTYGKLQQNLRNEFGTGMSNLNTLEDLKTALRIINGVETMDLPENLSASEQDEILQNSRGPSDAMAYVIERYIKNKLDDVSDEIEEATDDSIGIITEAFTVVMADE
jgi:hypothetical protein